MIRTKVSSQKEIYDLFYNLKNRGDLMLIATNYPCTWCTCSEEDELLCERAEDKTGRGSVEVYRSIKYPDLCFFQRDFISFNPAREDEELFSFDYADIGSYLVEGNDIYKPELYENKIKSLG